MTSIKRIIALVLALVALVSFVSCGGNPSITLAPEDSDDDVADIYSFVYKDVVIHVNDVMESPTSSDTVRRKIGEPLEYSESNSCAYLGLDKIYVYPGFTIYSYPDNGIDYVLMIVFTDDSVSTPAGISLGSKAEDVVAAYGGTWAGVDCNLFFAKDFASITVSIVSGTVKALQYCYDEK